MTIKQLLKNLQSPSNIIYYIKGKYRNFINKQYSKINDENQIERIKYRVYMCPDCYRNNSCAYCGCDFQSLCLTQKSCKNVEFNNS